MKILFLLAVPLLVAGKAAGQTPAPSSGTGYYYSDTLQNHTVEGQMTFANDTLRYRFNQLRYYVKTVMPYVNAATVLFNEIHTKLEQPGLSKSERKRYLAVKETEMRDRFENQIRSLNTTQGVLLIKLIARQTGLNIYSILADTKGNLSAMKFQTWARLHGVNLAKKYDPQDEPELERVMVQLGYEGK